MRDAYSSVIIQDFGICETDNRLNDRGNVMSLTCIFHIFEREELKQTKTGEDRRKKRENNNRPYNNESSEFLKMTAHKNLGIADTPTDNDDQKTIQKLCQNFQLTQEVIGCSKQSGTRLLLRLVPQQYKNCTKTFQLTEREKKRPFFKTLDKRNNNTVVSTHKNKKQVKNNQGE